MNKHPHVAVVGATGAVGIEMIKTLEKRNFPVGKLTLLASARSVGKKLRFKSQDITVTELTKDSFSGIDIALFSAGGGISKEFAPLAAKAGCVVVDNSSAFRMDSLVPLVVPEINAADVKQHKGIIANPNCTTAITLMALYPLHQAFGVKRIFASSYQAVSGTGAKAIEELERQVGQVVNQQPVTKEVYPHQIAFNVLPQVDSFLPSGYTKEEMKMENEGRKIMHHPAFRASVTCVRVPVYRSHSVAVSAEFDKAVTVAAARAVLRQAPGIDLVDEPENQNLQGETAGAQAFSNFDTLLAPFIRYDNLDYHQVKQAMQEFIFNLNVPTRTGFQTPFTNLTMDVLVPSSFKEKRVIVGGELKDKTYGDFQEEMYMFNNAFAEVMCEGDGNGRIFTFPIPTYNITKDFDWENPSYDEIWKMTAKYGTPYFANFVNSEMSEEDARSMCCRLRLDTREIKAHNTVAANFSAFGAPPPAATPAKEEEKARRGGLFASNPMTGSIGVVTINLPRMAKIAQNKKEFFELLKQYMGIAKESLELKRKIVEDLTDSNLYPYTRIYLGDIKKATGKYWTNHFSTIGLVGMNEAVLNLLKTPYDSKEGKAFAEEALDIMREQVDGFKKMTGNMYNLEASPAEGTSYRLARIDRKSFPDIVTAGTEKTPYYTNSVHLPVNTTDDIVHVLDHQDDLQAKFTGGTVIHFFLGESIKDIDTVKRLVKKICSNYKLPYFSLTPTFSVCPIHGYVSGEHKYCPQEHTKEDLEKFGIKVPNGSNPISNATIN